MGHAARFLLVAIAALPALALGGCLITEPIIPVDALNQIPEITNPNPPLEAVVTMPAGNELKEFSIVARDENRNLLVYRWQVNGTTKAGPAPNLTSFSVAGPSIGPPGSAGHTITVTVIDPQGESDDAVWNVVVP